MVNYFLRGHTIWLVYHVDGIRHRKSTGLKNTFQNLKKVQKEIIPLLTTKIITGDIYKKRPDTFKYYYDIFVQHKSVNRSFDNKHYKYKKLNQHFCNKVISSITRLDIKEYLRSLNIKTASLAVYKSALIEIFELAVDDGVINTNPAINIKLKTTEKSSIEYFTKDDVYFLLNRAEGIIKLYLLIAFNTGMRPEEILGLQLGDINDGKIDIKRVRTRGRIDQPKTKNSIRKIPCSDLIYDAVHQHKSKTIFLFDNIDDATKLRHQWKRLIDSTNIKYRKLYMTRHTYATHMLQDKVVSINELAGLLGHSSPRVTLSHYASVIDTQEINMDKNYDLYCHNTATVSNKKA